MAAATEWLRRHRRYGMNSDDGTGVVPIERMDLPVEKARND